MWLILNKCTIELAKNKLSIAAFFKVGWALFLVFNALFFNSAICALCWWRRNVEGNIGAETSLLCPCHRGGGIKWYRYPSVCLSHGATALHYRLTGCLQLSYLRTADPSASGCRSAASRPTGGISSRRPRVILCLVCSVYHVIKSHYQIRWQNRVWHQ